MASLQKPTKAFLSPLLLSGAAYLTQAAFKTSLKNSILHTDSSSQADGLFSRLFDPNGSIDRLKEASESISLEILGDYLTFMVLSIIFNLVIGLIGRVKGDISRQANNSKAKQSQSSSEEAKRANSKELTSFEIISGHRPYHKESLVIHLTKLIKPLIQAALCYTVAFCFFKITLLCAFAFSSSEKISLQPAFRVLDEEGGQDTPPTIFDNKTPEKVSLAMGRVLASFDVEPTIIKMSHDGNWAYVSTNNPHFIRVYDTSDFKAPVQVAAVNLGITVRHRMFLELSADETILVASNYEDVKIIDVKNPRSPRLAGQFRSPMHYSSESVVFVSMAISPDDKYLFMAEVGFCTLDISNPANITMLYTSLRRSPFGNGTLVSLSASSDRKVLYLANAKGALEIYNVANPSEPKLISNVSFTDSTATSVFLSKYDSLAYVVGLSDKKIAVNVLDVSNPLKVKEVSKFSVPTTKTTTPIIQALSPRETKLYIIQQRLMTIDLLTMSVESNSENLVKNSLLSICFSSNGQYTGVAYLEQIVFIELFTNYPNTKTFTTTNSSTASFVMDRRFESWAVRHDGAVLFAAFNDYERLNTSFEIWNIKNKEVPKRIVSLNATELGVNLTTPFLTFKMSPDNQRVYLKWWTRETSVLVILDVSGDLKTPVKLKEYTVRLSLNFEDFVFSKNEKILCTAPDSSSVVLYDLQGPVQNMIKLKFTSFLASENFELSFIKNDSILLIMTSQISMYNVSDISNPIFLRSIPMTEGGSPRILSTTVLEEEDCLIIEWYQTSRKLRVYNLSNILAPKLISELSLPKRSFDSSQDILQEFYGPFVYSEPQKVGYVGTNGKLLRVDLSDLKDPVISGIVPVTPCTNCGNSRFIISPDGNTAFATNQTGMLTSLDLSRGYLELEKGSDLNSLVFAIDLRIKYTLYIPQEIFLLGERFSDNVFILKNAGGKQGYQVTPRSQSKVLKLYSYDVKVVSSEPTPQLTSSSLPDWMKFNQDTLLLTVEAKSKKDLGVYTICSAISNEVNKYALDNIGPVNETFKRDELLTTLMTLGYMDHQFYLANEFGARDGFFLPEKYADYKSQIYDILSKYYVEVCTKIQIIPSLDVSILRPLNRIWIDTTSTEAMKVDITLLPNKNNQNAQFLQKVYGPLIPEIRDQKTRIVLEGNLNEIHTALQNVVINVKDMSSYDAIVTINDGLNYPIVNRRLYNISDCFLKNSPPFENPTATKTFQEQLERVSVATGQYFTIVWDETTFQDKYAENLHYEVIYDNDGNTGKPKAFPDWLSFSNLALRGTPPEKLSDREIPLKFIVKNEFQNITIPFKLNIGISPIFAMSLLIKYSPMLLTALGFYIKANKIYNVICKKIYKHPKEYQVGIREEISILPILFIKDELKESKRIMRYLLRYLEKKTELELVSYFVEEESRILDKKNLVESLNQALSDLSVKEKEKLLIYLDGSELKKNIITQLLINKISVLRMKLPKEKPTKKIFDEIKDQWADLVECNPKLMFIVNKEKLSIVLDKKNNLSLDTKESQSLLSEEEEVNQHLLQDSLISHAFSHQSLDARPTKVRIKMYESFKRHWLKVFLKKNLDGAHLNHRLGVDYGIDGRLEDGVLSFSGTPKENFKGRTLAIQIQTLKCRILKEIWIHEKSAVIESIARSESSLRGHPYEIY